MRGRPRCQTYQDAAGRLWDVLWMVRIPAQHAGGWSGLRYRLYRVPCDSRGVKPRLTTLKMVCAPGGQGKTVITITLPNGD